MPKLIGHVHVRAGNGFMVVFGPDDAVPGWALAQMDAGCFEPTTAPELPKPAEPPTRGPGSSRAAWAAYAQALNITVDPDASRTQIMEAVHGDTAA